MKEFAVKIKVIYLPFLLISLSFIVLYTFLHWLLILKSGLLAIPENEVCFWITFFLPWVPVLIWLRPRVRVLKLEEWPFTRMFFAVMIIAVPTLIAQHFIATATGKLTPLDRIEPIHEAEKTKYYTIDKVYVDTVNWGLSTRADVRGRWRERLNITAYFVFPLLDSEGDTSQTSYSTWLGLEYDATMSRRLPDSARRAEYAALVHEAHADFSQRDLGVFTYLERVRSTSDRQGFEAAARRSGRFAGVERLTILVPQDKPFESRSGKSLSFALGTYILGAAIWLLFLIGPKVDEAELKRVLSGQPSDDESLRKVINFLLFRDSYVTTPALFLLNLIIFLVMVVAGLGVTFFRLSDLLNWGALHGPDVQEGQWWRLVTNTFLHGGLMHLANNLVGLVIAGVYLEPIIKWRKFGLIFLTTGVTASIASLLYHPDGIAVGASGAIFGMYGYLLFLFIAKDKRLRKERWLYPFALLTVVLGLVIGAITPWINNAAHVGGLLAGLALGYLMNRGRRQK